MVEKIEEIETQIGDLGISASKDSDNHQEKQYGSGYRISAPSSEDFLHHRPLPRPRQHDNNYDGEDSTTDIRTATKQILSGQNPQLHPSNVSGKTLTYMSLLPRAQTDTHKSL